MVRPDLDLDGTLVGEGTRSYVIAEIGHNHQGNVETCKRLFDAAKAAGANAVKLQKRNNVSLFTKAMYDGVYSSENAFGDTYGSHREFLELHDAHYREVQAYAKSIGITFFATAFDIPSADFLENLNVPFYKLASGDLRSLPLLKHVAAFGKPLILSTGGGTMDDVQRAYDAVMPINRKLAILQCTAAYPPEFSELNLRVIETYRAAFPDIVIGFSSHDSGIAMPLIAHMLGSRIVEKHFTLNRTMKGSDHAFSLEPTGMRKLVRDLDRTFTALGDGVKRQYPSESKPLQKMAKKLVASRDLPAGAVIGAEDIAMKSPNDGLSPEFFDELVGRVTTSAIGAEQNLTFDNTSLPENAAMSTRAMASD